MLVLFHDVAYVAYTRQERIGSEVADHLAELMQPHGVVVHVRATHICTQIRGVREEHSTM